MDSQYLEMVKNILLIQFESDYDIIYNTFITNTIMKNVFTCYFP